MAYDGERVDGQVLDQLETILRHVAEELTGWRTRALKAETELKESGARGGAGGTAKPDLEARGRVADLEQENKTLRQRVEGHVAVPVLEDERVGDPAELHVGVVVTLVRPSARVGPAWGRDVHGEHHRRHRQPEERRGPHPDQHPAEPRPHQLVPRRLRKKLVTLRPPSVR